jgi:hypothetical protein
VQPLLVRIQPQEPLPAFDYPRQIAPKHPFSSYALRTHALYYAIAVRQVETGFERLGITQVSKWAPLAGR